MKILGWSALVLLLMLSLSGCMTAQPQCIDNVCSIFEEYPDWYTAAKASELKWGAPIAVQMAIIHQESSFIANARPPRHWILGCIPGSRPTSAYGYAQAIDDTWRLYKNKTGNRFGSRKNFEDAIDFVGWYTYSANCHLGIAPSNAYALYLAYHEGLQGYKRKTYFRKPWLMKVARKVGARARLYRLQMMGARS
jgi:hypothetical protein